MLKKIKLDFDFLPYIDADYTQHTGSCAKHQVKELTDVHEQYGGFPKSYCLENTMIHQLWWDKDQIDYVELGRQLGIEVVLAQTGKQVKDFFGTAVYYT